LGPTPIAGLESGVTEISTGDYHTCALTSAGQVFCWGSNEFGQLATTGGGVYSPSLVPMPPAIAVSAGTLHTCAVSSDKETFCWGHQTGAGSIDELPTPVPTRVSGLDEGARVIAATHNRTCVVTTTGAGKCWGSNSGGILGNGTTTDSAVPVQILGLESGLAGITVSPGNTCTVSELGAAKCWGNNPYGELGTWNPNWKDTPSDVSGLDHGVVEISVRGHHVCTVTDTAHVMCWGSNESGQLGTGEPGNAPVPVTVVMDNG